jgi:uncharacterized protein YbcI
MAQPARAVSLFEQRLTGHAPALATAILSDDTFVVSVQGALSPAERTLAQSAEGAAELRSFTGRSIVAGREGSARSWAGLQDGHRGAYSLTTEELA